LKKDLWCNINIKKKNYINVCTCNRSI
jgi:hypothetical protein